MKGKLYKCKVCLHKYRDKKLAQRCGIWCVVHDSCNLEVIKHAVNLKEWHKRMGKA